jgi:hypothetical protein
MNKDLISMKSLVITVLIGFGISAHAQVIHWEKVIQNSYEQEIADVINLSNDKVVLKYQNHLSALDIQPFMHAEIAWDGTIGYFDNYPAEHIMEAFDSNGDAKLLSIGSDRYLCDWCATGFYGEWQFFMKNPQTSALELMSSYGSYSLDTLFQGHYNYLLGNFPFPKGGFVGPNNEFVGVSGHRFFRVKVDVVGNIDDIRIDSLNENVIGLFPTINNTGIAFSANSLFSLDSDAQSTLIQSFPFTIDSVAKGRSATDFLCISADTFRIIDQSGIILDEFFASDYADAVIQVSPSANGFRMLFKSANSLYLNEYVNDQVINSFQPDTNKIDFKRFIFNTLEDEFMLLGYETSVINKHIVLQKYGALGNGFVPSNNNLAVVSLEGVNTFASNCVGAGAPPGLNFPIAYTRLQIRVGVKNNSDVAINSFYLNSDYDFTGVFLNRFLCPINCEDSQFSYKYTETIQPGQTKEVELWFLNGNDTNGVFPVCVWVSSPNSEIDRDPADDMQCIDITVGINNLAYENQAVLIYPNPSHDYIQYELPQGFHSSETSIDIFDISGRLIQRRFSTTNIGMLDLTDAGKGLYIISFTNKSGKNIRSKFSLN